MDEIKTEEQRVKEIRSRRKKQEAKNRNIILAVMAVLALLLVLLAFWHDKLFPEGDTEGTGNSTVDMTEQVMYQKTGDIYWNAETGLAEVYFENQEENSYNMKYTLTLEDTGEILYESALLTPGTVLTEIALELPDTEEEYAVVVSADSYDSETGALLSGIIYTKKIYVIQ